MAERYNVRLVRRVVTTDPSANHSVVDHEIVPAILECDKKNMDVGFGGYSIAGEWVVVFEKEASRG